jgi:hypothetical protein
VQKTLPPTGFDPRTVQTNVGGGASLQKTSSTQPTKSNLKTEITAKHLGTNPQMTIIVALQTVLKIKI